MKLIFSTLVFWAPKTKQITISLKFSFVHFEKLIIFSKNKKQKNKKIKNE